MTALIIAFLGVTTLGLVGAAPLYYALKNAATGYEDRAGFHGGQPTSSTSR